MDLVCAIFAPRPAPVIVETVPEYDYVYFAGEYIPYYEGWVFVDDLWHWAGEGLRPAIPPKWTPPPRPRHQAPPRHKVIFLPEHRLGHIPGHGPGHGFRHEAGRPEPPRTVVVRPEPGKPEVRHAPGKPEIRHEPGRPDRREKDVIVVRPAPKEKEKPAVHPAPKEKEKVTVKPEKRKDPPPKKGR